MALPQGSSFCHKVFLTPFLFSPPIQKSTETLLYVMFDNVDDVHPRSNIISFSVRVSRPTGEDCEKE